MGKIIGFGMGVSFLLGLLTGTFTMGLEVERLQVKLFEQMTREQNIIWSPTKVVVTFMDPEVTPAQYQSDTNSIEVKAWADGITIIEQTPDGHKSETLYPLATVRRVWVKRGP